MGTYILRRLLGMIPMLFAITVFVFLMMHAAPGNAIESMLNPRIKDMAALQAQLIRAFCRINVHNAFDTIYSVPLIVRTLYMCEKR